MKRTKRPTFNYAELPGPGFSEARNRLLFDWWCDSADRAQLIRQWGGSPQQIPSRTPRQDDPAPPFDQPPDQGWRDLWLFSAARDVHAALADSTRFSNQPYAALGGAGFMLAMEPGTGSWHEAQRRALRQLLDAYPTPQLRRLAQTAVQQATLTSLTRDDFDLADFAEQATLRFMGTLWGFGFQDHPLLQDSASAAYRGLHYLSFAQHFVSEPTTLPAAQQAIARLSTRCAALMEEYQRLARSPWRYGPQDARHWPTGVQPWSQLQLSGLGRPLLHQLAEWHDATPGSARLSGRDLAIVAACSLAGTVGNLINASCGLIGRLMPDLSALQALLGDDDDLEDEIERHLLTHPPVRVLPRRARVDTVLGGQALQQGEDFLLLLTGDAHGSCPHAWGDIATAQAAHACLGQRLSRVLLGALVRQLLALRGLRTRLDPLTNEELEVEERWGLISTRYPLRHDRKRRRVQQNLIVSMRVKAPQQENAAKLRRLIVAGAPRIEHVLKRFGHVHFAWFELTDDDSRLVLRTLYDGDFEAYLDFFAQNAGELFDKLFEYIDDAPPLPVHEHPREFIETIRRYNRMPLAGYLFSAYPLTEVNQIPGAQP